LAGVQPASAVLIALVAFSWQQSVHEAVAPYSIARARCAKMEVAAGECGDFV